MHTLEANDTMETHLPPAVNDFLQKNLKRFDFAFTVSNPQEPDNPICYASAQFYKMTGYTPEETIARNCRFLQGPGTEKRKVCYATHAHVHDGHA